MEDRLPQSIIIDNLKNLSKFPINWLQTSGTPQKIEESDVEGFDLKVEEEVTEIAAKSSKSSIIIKSWEK